MTGIPSFLFFYFLPRMATISLNPSKKGPQISVSTFSSHGFHPFYFFVFLPRMANMILIPSKKGPQISVPTFSSALSSRRCVINSGLVVLNYLTQS